MCARTEHDAKIQLKIIENCTSRDRVKVNSKKTEILQINKKSKELKLDLFDEKIHEQPTLRHLGLERNKHNKPDINKRISIALATMYSLMGAGLHGINGIYPTLAWKLWKIYVIPRMLYGIETLSITLSDMQKKWNNSRRKQ